MTQSSLYSKLLNAPSDAPVFLTPHLESDFLLKAYRFGLFPWTSNPTTWWCPDPRMTLFPADIYKQKSLRRFFKHYEFKLDEASLRLIKLCASTRKRTWIDDNFLKAYEELLKQGFLHSLEVYEKDELVGGIYGLIIGKVFFGESMVSLQKNVSKLAMIKLCELLEPFEFIIDCQVHNPHLEFMGAKKLTRKDFLSLLKEKVEQESGFESFKELL
ncbi:leucyl/phenylalanyl-tRNA--protein transferase [Campylobacter sp. MIT 12-5580]|uniref:leucyl/phenylalanyl-tRNA--protein transferase n=1 Tax=Campylobacter sp. MIT 12-5580 TaxID=2040651 RepID=UPI0010F54487|nr:leucyl/phenylalanyl-tRNA--protein transferase [Campylobacter sp. MIT 12-5580]TKX30281.1 leucyl/phenylalanyl-tRNA--protein transferase [Campylobacter sp. MIT 12-5580]